MVIGLAALAAAAPVVCDPAEAERIVEDAQISVLRAPVTHPWLVPGLARRADDPAVVAALDSLCAGDGDLFVERAEAFDQAGWSAVLLVLSRIEVDGCTLVHHRVPLSIGIVPDEPVYRVRGELPSERTPMGECDAPAVWREEKVLDGEDDAVRLVLLVDHQGDDIVHTHVAVRRATREGWSEQVVMDPAPPRLLDPAGPGPLVELVYTRTGQPMVVVSHDRTVSPCRAVGGQVVWQPSDGGWDAVSGRAALTVLAFEGLWREAGDDGFLLILGQDGERDAELVEPRLRRLQRRDPEKLYAMSSSDFPLLRPRYEIIVPAPWPSKAEAEAAKGRWTRSASAYVKQAWIAPDPCAP